MSELQNEKSILELAQKIHNMSLEQFKIIAPAIFVSDLWRMDWFSRLLVRYISWARNETKLSTYSRLISQPAMDKFVSNLKINIVKHIIHGKSSYDKKSIGGYSDFELQTLSELVSYSETN